MVKLIERGLVEDGYAVDVTSTGEDALEMARASPFDVIVLDLVLPGIDGLEVCRELRRNDVSTPVLILTARDGADDRAAGLASGADDYMTKPFSFVELLGRLRSLASSTDVG